MAGAAALWTAVVALAGGVTLGSGRLGLSSKDPARPLAAAAVLALTSLALLGRARFAAAVQVVIGRPDQRSRRVAVAASAAVFVVAVAWNTRAAGGSDSSCYLLQADAFAHGRVTLPAPPPDLPPGVTPALYAPTGFVASPRPPFAPVPICAAGLAVVMAPAVLARHDLVFLIVPLFAALAVWCTFLLGARCGDAVAGAGAAILLACSPVFLYQAVQPMSDVPAASLLVAALVLLARGDGRGRVAAGVCASLAVLMRPTAALAAAPLLVLLPAPGGSRGWLRGWVAFACGAAPAAGAMLLLNAARYGSAFASGYGSTGALFSWAHVVPNLTRYPGWLVETETPFVALAAFAPAVLRGRPRRVAVAAAGIVTLTVAIHLAYTVFDEWWYLRFLLPALPLLLVFSVVVLRRIVPRVAVVAACAAIAAWGIHVAVRRQVFELQGLESRFRLTGEYAARALPANAVVFAVQQSGSARFHGGRASLSWDVIAPDALDGTIAWARARGFAPVIALEDEEAPRFRARFGTQAAGQLDWPPDAEIHAPVRVRIFDPGRRVEYTNGGRVQTEHIRR